MKRWMILCAVVSVWLCNIVQAANDFSADANCVALYNLESGALITDSKSTNTLTNTGFDEDLVLFKQGSCSGKSIRANADRMTRLDADLTAGFPGKSGTSNKSFTIATWTYFDTIGIQQQLVSKSIGAGARVWNFYIWTTNVITLSISPDGTAWNYYLHASALSVDTWYHIAVTYDGNNDDSYRIRIHDESGLVGVDLTGTGSDMFMGTSSFVVSYASTSSALDGNLDEIVVFNRALSLTEIDQIWAGTYGAAAGAPPQIIQAPLGDFGRVFASDPAQAPARAPGQAHKEINHHQEQPVEGFRNRFHHHLLSESYFTIRETECQDILPLF